MDIMRHVIALNLDKNLTVSKTLGYFKLLALQQFFL